MVAEKSFVYLAVDMESTIIPTKSTVGKNIIVS